MNAVRSSLHLLSLYPMSSFLLLLLSFHSRISPRTVCFFFFFFFWTTTKRLKTPRWGLRNEIHGAGACCHPPPRERGAAPVVPNGSAAGRAQCGAAAGRWRSWERPAQGGMSRSRSHGYPEHPEYPEPRARLEWAGRSRPHRVLFPPQPSALLGCPQNVAVLFTLLALSVRDIRFCCLCN